MIYIQSMLLASLILQFRSHSACVHEIVKANDGSWSFHLAVALSCCYFIGLPLDCNIVTYRAQAARFHSRQTVLNDQSREMQPPHLSEL